MLKKIASSLFKKLGYQVLPLAQAYPEASAADLTLISEILNQEVSMASYARLWSTLASCRYVEKAQIEGDFVECGVWRGGNSLLASHEFLKNPNNSRKVWLFDTFGGMTAPTEDDKHEGIDTEAFFKESQKGDHNTWCYASLEDVKSVMVRFKVAGPHLKFVKGPVESTLLEQQNIPDSIAVLRLDTDWYESTKAELEVLFPRLNKGGVLIVDDYGYWEGARKAVDEYFKKHGIVPLLQPIDDTGRIWVKT